jgi:hypothetical protein
MHENDHNNLDNTTPEEPNDPWFVKFIVAGMILFICTLFVVDMLALVKHVSVEGWPTTTAMWIHASVILLLALGFTGGMFFRENGPIGPICFVFWATMSIHAIYYPDVRQIILSVNAICSGLCTLAILLSLMINDD